MDPPAVDSDPYILRYNDAGGTGNADIVVVVVVVAFYLAHMQIRYAKSIRKPSARPET